jgi:hypothetical protein
MTGVVRARPAASSAFRHPTKERLHGYQNVEISRPQARPQGRCAARRRNGGGERCAEGGGKTARADPAQFARYAKSMTPEQALTS